MILQPFDSLTDDEKEWVEEREAIRHIDAGLPLGIARLEALKDLARYKRDLARSARM